MPTTGEGSNISLAEIPTRIISGILDIGTLDKGISKEKNIPISRINADPEKYKSQSLMRYNTLLTQTVSMMIPCNTNLSAGDVIDCKFPKNFIRR